jgi:hypothetical protein
VSDKKAKLREVVRNNLDAIMMTLNAALRGKGLQKLEPVVKRIGRGGQLPHWYAELKDRSTIVNLDGKTIGSILEMLLVAVLETGVLKKDNMKLRVNPARGIDLPDLDLGVKSPSKNYCTSEPFFSAYERLYGNEHDCLIILTDYQEAKRAKSAFKLQAESWEYLRGSEIADLELCRIAKKNRKSLLADDPAIAKRVLRFLAYVNQSDWRCRRLLELVDHMNDPVETFDKALAKIEKDYEKQNKSRLKKNNELIPESDLLAMQKVFQASPRSLGVINQLDNWVTDFLKDASRAPNDNEWERLLKSPLDGKIGMSFALQWRYNFGKLFGKGDAKEVGLEMEDCD